MTGTGDADTTDIVLSIYKAYLDDLGRIGARHETLRQFYLSVISALFVFLSLAGSTGALLPVHDEVLRLVGGVGLLICLSWFLHMWTFGTIYRAKRHALAEGEAKLPFTPFTIEKTFLSGQNYFRLTIIDRFVAIVFAILFLVLVSFKTAT